MYFLAYMVSPLFCHRFVGYLEEEAVHTYTMLLEQNNPITRDWLEKSEAPVLAA